MMKLLNGLPILAAVCLVGVTSAESPPPAEVLVQSAVVVEDGDASVTFFTDQAVLWSGRTQVIAFKVSPDPNVDRRFVVKVVKGKNVQPVGEAVALAGYELGYLRVRVTEPGSAVLRINQSEVKFEAKPSPSHSLVYRTAPKITSPAQDAVAWGTIGVSAHYFDDATQYPDGPRQVRLRLPDGSTIQPVESTTAKFGPILRAGFQVELDNMKPGVIELVAEAVAADGSVEKGEPIRLHVIRPSADRLIDAEAESYKDQPRPDRYTRKNQEFRPLKTQESKEASGGVYVTNSSSYPPLTMPVKAEQGTWYQMMLKVSGDDSSGSLPTVGVRWGEDNRVYRASPIAMHGWHRSPIGRPFKLKAGDHQVLAYFENDANSGKKHDRNLRIDRVELYQLTEQEAAQVQTPSPFYIALDQRLINATLGGSTEIHGRVSRIDGREEATRVTLLVNGEAIDVQHSSKPIFYVPRNAFKPGDNTIQLRAEWKGRVADSVLLPMKLADHPAKPAVDDLRRRYFVADSHWKKGPKLQEDKRAGGHPVMAFYSEGSAELELPESMAGQYKLAISARGDSYKGKAIGSATLVTPDARVELGQVEADNNYRELGIKEAITLSPGPKTIEVAFINDAHDEAKKKDRNLFLRGVQLKPVLPQDKVAPVAEIIYPAEGHEAFGVDAVIVQVSDDRTLNWVQLLVDGEPASGYHNAKYVNAQHLLPLILRGLEPGSHQLAVRVRDEAGNVADSEARSFQVLAEEPASPGDYERAVRLLDRLAYGPDTRELAEVLLLGRREYLRQHLFASPDAPGAAAAWEKAKVSYLDRNSHGNAAQRAISYMANTSNPVQGRLTFFVDNHFNTWMRKTNAFRKADEFETWRSTAPGPFADQLMASATSPAMLLYLDQQRSRNKRINENYAREIMELHTLGVNGGYVQNDVTELAHLLTGWAYTDTADAGLYPNSEWRYQPHRNDPHERTVFGMRFPAADESPDRYDRARLAVEFLAAHPSTAKFQCKKLAEHYVDAPAPEPLINEMVDVFHRTGGDLREVVFALAESEHVAGTQVHHRLTHPIGFAIRLQRAVGEEYSYATYNFVRSSGFGVFERETPDGYPLEDESYANTNAMLQRWRFAERMQNRTGNLVPWSMHNPPKEADEAAQAQWRQSVVDLLAVRLTGRPLSDRSNQAVLDVFAQTKTNGITRVRFIGALIAQMPESSLR